MVRYTIARVRRWFTVSVAENAFAIWFYYIPSAAIIYAIARVRRWSVACHRVSSNGNYPYCQTGNYYYFFHV